MSSVYDKYESVIGLEVHAQMKTNTKAFCRCSTDFHSSPNSNVCPVCLGYPGTLPVLNQELVEYTIRMGLATNCSIREVSIFSRKNYFYPDLTKGYQITQFDTPVCYDGYLDVMLNDNVKRIGITRIHMEEDAGKSVHDFSDNDTLIDFNRCGVPLIEIVSEPDIRSSEEAYQYLSKIRQRLVYLDINDGNLEEGSMRCDANISVRLKGAEEFGTRTEVKNLNSFKNVSEAIEAEIKRQIDVIEGGGKVNYQTMTYNAKDKKTSATRSKEEAHDYRYFPEPDLVKVRVGKEWISNIEKELPEFPEVRRERFINEYDISRSDADEITQDKFFADKFERCIGFLLKKDEKSYRSIANIFRVDIKRIMNEQKLSHDEIHLSDKVIAMLADSVSSGTISATASKEIFNHILNGKTEEEQISIFKKSEQNLSQVSDDSEIEIIVKKILDENPGEVARYKIGEKKLAGFFVGKIMQESKGKANPKIVNEILIKNLEI
ncbi:MAG TPA: Asp-tRNA(Asn)/Glu-tRNA(Gln) amidotransferase subunit GatB [Ignavibacteria bacterium]|nr:Asp-tRNA(Asn)/Glu-tRNA(Gln) amidotransferase subunit GatB [Ignavibacteria bacterium]HMR39090.1 Asp-tRNA(Asn)/Glu-tRNA(Gln) amidotransferase subunit GatB [Ignavibacteria bacterium]